MRRIATAAVAVGMIVALSGVAGATAPCPRATAALSEGAAPLAEQAARACLARSPDAVAVWLQLSRALGHQGRHSAALTWVERVLERAPGDAEAGLWRVRLLAWGGHHHDAEVAFDALVARDDNILGPRESALLDGDLRFWQGAWSRAADGYSRFLSRFPDDRGALRKRGISYLQQGLGAHALADLERACTLAGGAGPACGEVRHAEAALARADLRITPRFSLAEGSFDEAAVAVSAAFRVWRQLHVGATTELSRRTFGPDAQLDDVTLSGTVAWRGRDLYGWAELGGAPAATFLPSLTARAGVGVTLTDGLVGELVYRHLGYEAAGSHIVTPGLTWWIGRWDVDARYHLAIPTPGDPTHAGLVRVGFSPSRLWYVQVGGGAGNGTEYLDPSRGDVSGHWLVLGQLAFKPSWRHEVRAGYSYREEQTTAKTARRHEWQLTYRLRL